MNASQQSIEQRFEFRTIRADEVAEAIEIESACFPPNEACAPEMMAKRIAAAREVFLVAVDRKTGVMAGFINGIATDEASFRDEFFVDASIHDPNGANLMIAGLDVRPEYRLRGLGYALMARCAEREARRGRKKLILTCHATLVGMYKKMGFRDLGMSASVWGGEAWHEMERVLNANEKGV